MRFAIVSDVHGNLPALNAVIEDAEKNGVDCFLFVGDYFLSNPYPDECISRMRALEKKYMVQGNEEKYLENLMGQDPNTWTDGQMQALYYSYQNMSPDNRDYLLSIPNQMTLTYHGVTLHMAHSSAAFIAKCEHREWRPSKMVLRYGDTKVTQAALREDIHQYFKEDEQFRETFEQLENGIYIFGHSHIQWSYSSDDGKKVLINPGSCGLPLDYIEGMPYTILDISADNEISVEEKRIPFPVDEYIEDFRQSKMYEQAAVWSKVITEVLKFKRERISFFLQFTEKYATEIGDNQRPFSVSTWEKAYELWEAAGKCQTV